MNRKPGRRRLTWFGKNQPGAPTAANTPNTLGKMWRREPRGRGETDSWLVGEPQAPDGSSSPRPDWEQYPNLPALPPPFEDNGFAARRASADRRDQLGGDSSTDAHATPIWGQPDSHADSRQDRPHDGRLRALWWKVATRFRRPRLALTVVAGALALCLLLGVAALGAAFPHGAPNSAHGARGANGALVSPTSRTATPNATTTTTTTPGNTHPPTPLTIAFTCASGVAGGTGQLCVHTLPNAALSLAVRYCDGSYAKGKAFHAVSYADGSGNYTWRWNVTTSCGGAATATVTANSAGQTATQSATFTVTL